MTATEWVPGIPLHDPDRHPNSRYLYDLRDESPYPVCHCADAASWPNPRGLSAYDLDGTPDELERFITETRAGRPEEDA